MVLVHVLAIGIGLVLGMLGGGGAILAVPILVYAGHFEPKAAIAMSLAVVGATAAIGAFRHARAGNVRWKEGLIFAAAGVTGAFGGAKLSELFSGHVLLVGFAALMLVSAYFMWRPIKAEPQKRNALWTLPVGLAVGTLTGLVGAGGGFVVVPALTLIMGISMRESVGTSLLVIALQSAAGLVGHLGTEGLDFRTVGTVTLASSGGLVVGVAFAARISQLRLRQAFAALMAVAAVYIGVRELALPPGSVAPQQPAATADSAELI